MKTWLPLAGKLIGITDVPRRDGTIKREGRGDEANPVRMLPVMELEFPGPLTSDVIVSWVSEDWESHQVFVEIEGPADFIDWLGTEHGILEMANQDRMPQGKRTALLSIVNSRRAAHNDDQRGKPPDERQPDLPMPEELQLP